MGVDYSQLAFPKNAGKLRVEVQREKRLTNEEKERNCRAEVWRLYGHKCHVPGCREKGQQHHLIYRSQSRRLKYEPTNRRPVCQVHHDLIHGGKITVTFQPDGEVIFTGDKRYLSFKL